MGLGYTYRWVLIGLRLGLGKGVGVEFWEGLGLRSVQPRRLPLHTGGEGARRAQVEPTEAGQQVVYPCTLMRHQGVGGAQRPGRAERGGAGGRLPLHIEAEAVVRGRTAPRSSEARRTWGVYPSGNR